MLLGWVWDYEKAVSNAILGDDIINSLISIFISTRNISMKITEIQNFILYLFLSDVQFKGEVQ